jgi:cytidylate kinase
MKIAIDGPAGSGKSTIAKILSKELNLPYLDTGKVYRAFAYIAKEEGIDMTNTKQVLSLFDKAPVVHISIAKTEVSIGGKCLDVELKGEDTGRYASMMGSIPEFRERMVKFFRKLVGDAQVVAEGRDVGTHIFPDAPIKLFITASLEERARRRFLELSGVSFQEVLKALAERDKRDMERPIYPFKPAEDAIIVDTTGKSIEQAVEEVLRIIKGRAIKSRE